MSLTPAHSSSARDALELVESLQARFVGKLEELSSSAGAETAFTAIEWLRDAGLHGGGVRFETGDTALFDRASVNVSQVHYDDDPGKRLGSATALSTIIHPRNPLAPSVHVHISWTELREGGGYWRVMADLNPAVPVAQDTAAFEEALRAAAPAQYEAGRAQGEHYFFIPALGRHRGASHFYLEGYSSDDREADFALARAVGEVSLDRYVELLEGAHARSASDADRAAQLAYHTLYFFQVLTLDRGTSAGLLVHDQNDVGILGSLPSHVDRELLASWGKGLVTPQDELLAALVDALPDRSPAPVTDEAKTTLASLVRAHYQAHPEALSMQAAGDILPPTVDNHRPK